MLIIPREARENFSLNFQLSGWALVALSSSVNRGHVAANRSDRRATEFVNTSRNVVFASKSEGWCALSPIAGTGSRDKYIMISQEYKARRELTQSSCPKVMFTTCTDSRPSTRLNLSQGTSKKWHPRLDYELLL